MVSDFQDARFLNFSRNKPTQALCSIKSDLPSKFSFISYHSFYSPKKSHKKCSLGIHHFVTLIFFQYDFFSYSRIALVFMLILRCNNFSRMFLIAKENVCTRSSFFSFSLKALLLNLSASSISPK